jgi:hypothetical protein
MEDLRMTRRLLPVVALAALLLIAGLACSLLTGPVVSTQTSPTSERTAPEATPRSEQPTQPTSDVLFSDDFSDTSSGWDRVSADNGVTDYTDSQYRIFVNSAQHDFWANPGQSFSDVSVEVDATKAAGPDNNDFGVICRYQDTQNFYSFLISSDGYYAIMKYSGGDSQILGADAMLSTDAVQQGAATNHIRADCAGENLSLYANGQLLHSASDSEFASGDVGLMAGTFDEAGTDILFDNFVVSKP